MASTAPRVLLLVDGLWVGGTERSLAELLPHLRSAAAVSVACLRRCSDGVEQEVIDSGVEVHFLTGPWREKRSRLRQLLRLREIDILHSSLLASNLLARSLAWGPSRVLNSLVNTPYDPARTRDLPRWHRWRLRIIQALDALSGRVAAHHFHAVSETVKQSAVRRQLVPPGRVTVVPRGRDRRRLGWGSPERRRSVRARLGIPYDAPVLLGVGRQDRQKNLEFLLRAAALLRRKRPGLQVLIAGRPGTETARLEELAFAAGALLLGHRQDVPDLLAASDLLVFPSRFEGMPGAVIEAMALGVPVAGSDVPPVREVLEGTGAGILFDIDDTEQHLADIVDDVLRQPEMLTAMGAAGVAAFEERFTIERSAERMLALYRSLASRGTSD